MNILKKALLEEFDGKTSNAEIHKEKMARRIISHN